MAERSDVESPFPAPTSLLIVNGSAADFDGSLAPNGLELFFSSARSGAVELWHTQRQCSSRVGVEP
jgi:hypothetical protein